MRRPFVAGNWKMNLNLDAARALVDGLRESLNPPPALDIAICPPAIYLFPMAKAITGSAIQLGAQNCWIEPKGAFTGELSAEMVRETGCEYVILGHSERRHTIGPKDSAGRVQGETDELIAAKCAAALRAGLTPILCVGETLEERDHGKTEAVLDRQIERGMAGLTGDGAKKLVVAYEPVWAIGTGRNATPEQAQSAHRHIRQRMSEHKGKDFAEGVRIQYGGSVKPDNAFELVKCPDVDGALVGGASLVAADLCEIIRACARAKGLN